MLVILFAEESNVMTGSFGPDGDVEEAVRVGFNKQRFYDNLQRIVTLLSIIARNSDRRRAMCSWLRKVRFDRPLVMAKGERQ